MCACLIWTWIAIRTWCILYLWTIDYALVLFGHLECCGCYVVMLIWFCVGYIVCETYNVHSELWYAQHVKIFNFFCYSLSKQDFSVHKQRISPSGHWISVRDYRISFFEFEKEFRSDFAKFGEIRSEILFPLITEINSKNGIVNLDSIRMHVRSLSTCNFLVF